MKFKHILPIFLLLSLCAGMLTGCNLIAAEEPPAETQAPELSGVEEPEDDGIFTITDDERIGDIYQKILNGEIVLECFDDSQIRMEKRSARYVREYMMGVLQRLNTIEVEPMTDEEFQQEAPDARGIVNYVFNACSLSENFSLIAKVGTNYIGLYFQDKENTMGNGLFRTKQNVDDIKKDIQSFWQQEARAPFRGIADHGGVGEPWSELIAEDAAENGAWRTLSVWDRKGRIRHIDADASEIAALADIFRQLDELVVKEEAKLCTCDNCLQGTKWDDKEYLLDVYVNSGLWEGVSLHIYRDAIIVHSVESGEAAYFELQTNAGVNVSSRITALFEVA